MLKSQDNLNSAPVTDVNANLSIDSENARHISPEAAILFNKAIVAKPLMTPELASIHVKNTEYRYRWVNLEGRNGQMYMKRRAQGFTDATLDDVALLSGDATTTDGKIRAGDCVLMKIRADLYDAHIKDNMVKAMVLSRMRGVSLEGASTDVMADDNPHRVSVSNEPFARKGLAKPFIPDDPDKIINDSISSGRADKARKALADVHEKNNMKVE